MTFLDISEIRKAARRYHKREKTVAYWFANAPDNSELIDPNVYGGSFFCKSIDGSTGKFKDRRYHVCQAHPDGRIETIADSLTLERLTKRQAHEMAAALAKKGGL